MTSKCGKNRNVDHEVKAECITVVTSSKLNSRIKSHCLISYREGLGMSLQIMGLATMIHKIPKFGVNQASFD